MVKITANSSFSMSYVNFGFYKTYLNNQDNASNTDAATLFSWWDGLGVVDAYAAQGVDYDADYGSMLAITGQFSAELSLASGSPAWSGTVSSIAECSGFESTSPFWIATGLSLSASSLKSAIGTASTTDDIALMKAALTGADTFILSSESDRAYGYGGKDTMKGYGGNDYLRGGTGQDKLYGGTGADDFIYNDGETGKTSTTRDIIYDFVKGTDDLDLRYVDANTKKSGDQAFVYSGTTADNNEVWYKKSGANVIVYGDNTGDGVADFAIELRNVSSLSATDFLL